ncbi:MAG: hypothetical protein JWP97_5812 [Labilithrix sp.]|nr:hypothetical protein [Labilithrix sp.]
MAPMKTEIVVLRALFRLSRAQKASSTVTVADLVRHVREDEHAVASALSGLARDGLVVRRGEIASLSFSGLALAAAATAQAKLDAAKAKAETRSIAPARGARVIAMRSTRAA